VNGAETRRSTMPTAVSGEATGHNIEGMLYCTSSTGTLATTKVLQISHFDDAKDALPSFHPEMDILQHDNKSFHPGTDTNPKFAVA
jgi:hypothetical protein